MEPLPCPPVPLCPPEKLPQHRSMLPRVQAAAGLALTAALLATPAGLAFAEDAAPDVAAAAAGAVEAAADGPIVLGSAAEIGLVLSPIVLYGIFNIYRKLVDPRAKVSLRESAVQDTALNSKPCVLKDSRPCAKPRVG